MNGFIQHALLAKPNQRRHRQLIVAGLTAEVIAGTAQGETEQAGLVFDLRAFRPIAAIEALYGAGGEQMLLDVIDQGIGQHLVGDQLVAIVTVFLMLMQINVVDAGATVDHGIVDHKALQVQYAQRFAGIDRHAVDRHRLLGMLAGHGTVPVGVGIGGGGADAAALCAVPVDQHADFQLGPPLLGLIQRVEDLAPGVVMLQIQGHQIDALGSVGDGVQQRGAKIGRRVQRTNISNRLGEFGQLCKVLLMFATFKF